MIFVLLSYTNIIYYIPQPHLVCYDAQLKGPRWLSLGGPRRVITELYLLDHHSTFV